MYFQKRKKTMKRNIPMAMKMMMMWIVAMRTVKKKMKRTMMII